MYGSAASSGDKITFNILAAQRMSNSQYYEFQAIDRPLNRPAQDALRSISSRARITATGFIDHHEWGDLKGDRTILWSAGSTSTSI